VLANSQYDAIEARHPLMARVSFFIDVCKIILDTLRQNAKTLDFYNATAQRVFDFCQKYNYRFEYNRVSETLHSHFNQVLKFQKQPELLVQSKIPFPVRLDEEDALQKLLELRYHQLKIALKMKIWSDAFRTTENIYQLINRQKHHASRMKQILADFFTNLSEIFWQSEFYLFHAYAIMNLQQIIKFNKTLSDFDKAQLTAQFVLSVLSVPLNNRLSNFERLSVQYIPSGMEQLQDSNSSARQELFSIASMLQVKGVPSRASLINYVRIKNIHLQPEFPEVQELFNLIEDEESPFVISKKGKAIIDKLAQSKNANISQYRDFLVKTLSVRILQKCRNYFKNLKMSTLKNLL
jgi:translation initiation factor 3 subunit A